jgi:hypothetical protein
VPALSPAPAPTTTPAVLDEHLARAARAEEYTLGLDFAEAHRELEGADEASPALALERGRLAIYEGDFDGATALLARPDLARTDEGALLADIARGSARATAATIREKDDRAQVDVRYQDEADRALGPLLIETVVAARDALTRDLGVTWPKPTRIVVVRDLLTLAAMTGLPYESAQTTGTVAVAKWGRVTLLSPRASRDGYAWRDTMTHELTHLAITRATVDRAPLWLQEGLAKREEVRWRDPGPFDERPPPEAIVQRGIELKLDLPLDKLGPSIAMLPSADAAMVAFAEVTSFVKYLANTASPDALPRILLALRNKRSTDEALAEVTSADLKGWDARWRGQVAGPNAKREKLPATFGLGIAATHDLRDLRERARLAELLMGRAHPSAALSELDKVDAKDSSGDPSLRYLRARALEAASDHEAEKEKKEALVADPAEVATSFGPWWAIRGRWARARADHPLADMSFLEGVAEDPFDIEVACQSLEPNAPAPIEPRLAPLCEAARRRAEPGLGQD